MNSTAPTYTRTAIALHWLMALLVIGTFLLGLYMTELPNSPTKLRTYNWHKWAGGTFLALAIVRAAWRIGHEPPAAPALPAWQMRLASAVHGLMYLMFFVVPLIGWAYSSSLGYPLVWFGVLPLPDFMPVDRDMAKLIKPWHESAAWFLAGLVMLHVAGALKHHFVDRDTVLRRMAPWVR
jgi:cytochrome b561